MIRFAATSSMGALFIQLAAFVGLTATFFRVNWFHGLERSASFY
jgi:hypothetical protein